MKCPYCGTVIDAADAVFCPECGRHIAAAAAVPPKISRPKRARRQAVSAPRHYGLAIAAAAVLAVLVGSVIAFTVYFDLTTDDWRNLFRRQSSVQNDVPSLQDLSSEREAAATPEPTEEQADMAGTEPPPEANDAGEENGAQDAAVPDAPEQATEVMVTLPGGTQAPAVDFIFPYSSSQALTTTDLDNAFAGLDSASAALFSQQAINEVYARYGYRFHPELSDAAQWASQYFGSLDWYNNIVYDGWANTGEVPINSIESANIDLIVGWQVNHGYR